MCVYGPLEPKRKRYKRVWVTSKTVHKSFESYRYEQMLRNAIESLNYWHVILTLYYTLLLTHTQTHTHTSVYQHTCRVQSYVCHTRARFYTKARAHAQQCDYIVYVCVCVCGYLFALLFFYFCCTLTLGLSITLFPLGTVGLTFVFCKFWYFFI